ncbi:hypothetical protein [Rossellomorea marisflavi]|uniref:hypothetical protein n=1 Tax=Rossellomorea marisflavi TaxID=189381 RepID=UPI003FA0697F
MDLETIKRFDDSWWLSYLREKTVFDADTIKAHKEWLLEQAEQLERIKQLSNAEELTLVDFAKEVLIIIEGRETPRRSARG